MILDKLLIFTGVIASLYAVFNISGANLYTIKQLNNRRRRNQHPHAAQFRRRPPVSVIVPTWSDEDSIVTCLNNIIKSSYRKLEIIVVDNGSKDSTKKLVRQFIASNPNKTIKLYARRRPGDLNHALKYANKTYVSGEYVILLDDASNLLSKDAVKNSIMHFNDDDKLAVLSVNYKVKTDFKIAGLFQEFGLLLSNRCQKAASAFNNLFWISSKGAAIYSREVFSMTQANEYLVSPSLQFGNRGIRCSFASDVLVYGPSLSLLPLVKDFLGSQLQRIKLLVEARRIFLTRSPNYSHFLAWVYLPFLALLGIATLILPALFIYFTYLAVNLHQPTFLVISWVVLGIFLVFAIWDDEQMKILEKLKYIVLIPITYSWFGVVMVLQYFALVGGLVLGAKAGLRKR